MIDIKRIVEETEKVKEGLLKRMEEKDLNLEEIIALYDTKKEKQTNFEQLRAQQNSHNEKMAQVEKGSEEFNSLIIDLKTLSEQVKAAEEELKQVDGKLNEMVEALPNIPDEDVVAGEKEANEIVKSVGEKREFGFEIKDHIEIAEQLDMIDMERAAKLAGAGFTLYKGWGARFEWAMIQYFIDTHNKDRYKMILPPYLLTRESGYTAGQLPKFEEDVFWLEGRESFLLPTAETALANLYRDEVIDESELPMKLFSFTQCFRKEAGSYRANERGLMRMHQFNKVEMFQYTKPEDSTIALEELVKRAEDLVEALGLHYNTVKLAAGDCSAGAAKTFDIEVFLPYLDRYIEVSSISNVRDYQARRGNIKFKSANGGKAEYVHMLNASGLATSRLMVAVLETYQNEDGSLTVPEVLRAYLGVDKIEKGM
jgi:seryl-tRNA synthetase